MTNLPTISEMLNAGDSFEAGRRQAEQAGIENVRKAQLALAQQKQTQLIENDKARTLALEQIKNEGFNNPQALTMIYGVDKDLGDRIAKERDIYNRTTSSVIDFVLNTPLQERQNAWDKARSYLKSRGISTSDLPAEYDDKNVGTMLKMKQREIRTWEDNWKTINTDKGLALLGEKSGEISPTPYNTLENAETAMKIRKGESEIERNRIDTLSRQQDILKTKAETARIYDDIKQNRIKIDKEFGNLSEKEKGAEQVSYIGERMKELYGKLDQAGGIINPDKGVLHNLGARFRSGEWVGQNVGKAFGTEEQSWRREINNLRNQAKVAIMQATGLSAKAFDSNAEAKALLDSLGNPDQDIKSSLNAVESFVGRYGKKGYNYKSPEGQQTKQQTLPAPKIGVVEGGYEYIGGDPSKESSWRRK